ncbi:MAG: LysE family transporter [Anaerolineae bacterium]|nr:LysE family transporter [Anaerolineae bacterium]
MVNTEAVRRGLVRGFRSALMVELGSLIGDATWAIIAMIGLAFIAQSSLVRLLLGFVGAAILIYLAWNAIRDARRGIVPQPDGAGTKGDFSTGALLSIGNPFAVAFWLGVSGSVISITVSNPQPEHFAIFFAAFMLGGLLWSIFLSSLVAWGRRFLKPDFYRWVNLLCGMMLGYFGVKLLWNTIMSL